MDGECTQFIIQDLAQRSPFPLGDLPWLLQKNHVLFFAACVLDIDTCNIASAAEKYLFLFLTVSSLKAVTMSVSLLYLGYYLTHIVGAQ